MPTPEQVVKIENNLLDIGTDLDALEDKLKNNQIASDAILRNVRKITTDMATVRDSLLKHFSGTESEHIYKTTLWIHSNVFITRLNEYSVTHNNTENTIKLLFNSQLEPIKSFIREYSPDTLLLVTQPDIIPNQTPKPNVAKTIFSKIQEKIEELASKFVALAHHLYNKYPKPVDLSQRNFFRKSLFWIFQILQAPLTIAGNLVEFLVRNVVKGFFYFLRHPLWIVNKLQGKVSTQEDQYLEDKDLNDEEFKNLTKIQKVQYVIKEIGIGFDNFLKRSFQVVEKPLEAIEGIFAGIINFLKVENKWDLIKETWEKGIEEFNKHKIRSSTEIFLWVLTFVLSIVLPIYLGPTPPPPSLITAIEETAKITTAIETTVGATTVSKSMGLVQTVGMLAQQLPKTAAGFLPTAAPTLVPATMAEGVGCIGQLSTMAALSKPLGYADKTTQNIKNTVSELKNAIELLQRELSTYNPQKDQAICLEITNEIDQLKSRLLQHDSSIDDVYKNYREGLEKAISILQEELKTYNSELDPEPCGEINKEIKILENKLAAIKTNQQKLSINTTTETVITINNNNISSTENYSGTVFHHPIQNHQQPLNKEKMGNEETIQLNH